MDFCKKQPCNNCPYRKDAPLKLWSIDEFKDLMQHDKELFSPVYGCHKKDGHTCVGWLIDQDNRGFPSIQLRMMLSKKNIDRNYLDNLGSKVEMYQSIEEMSKANYPESF